MRFSPFDFDVITTPDEAPPHKPSTPVPLPEGRQDRAKSPQNGALPESETST